MRKKILVPVDLADDHPREITFAIELAGLLDAQVILLHVVDYVPTVLPVVVLLGSMGWLGLSLDVGRAMIAAVIVGIGVDDTVHLLSHFRNRWIAGATAPEAIRQAVLFVGRPVITSSVALSVGFLSLMTSSWQTVSSFGL